jgi:hypothetical protein
MPKRCPPGIFCISNSFIFALIGVLVFAIAFLLWQGPFAAPASSPLVIRTPPQPPMGPLPAYPGPGPSPSPIAPPAVGLVDTRFARPPQPLRDWLAPPELPPRGGLATIPINIPTQGLPEQFQPIGNLKVHGSDKILPLYGRRTATGNGMWWNYYTRTDTFNPVPLPIRYQRRDCMDDVGCNELFSGETIRIETTGENAKVTMFRYDGPKYIPGLL